MKETIKENRKSSYVVMDAWEKEQISPPFDTLKEARQYLKEFARVHFQDKYDLCIMKDYVCIKENLFFRGTYLKQHMKRPEISSEDRDELYWIFRNDKFWGREQRARKKLEQLFLWEDWKSRAKSLEKRIKYERFIEKEK